MDLVTLWCAVWFTLYDRKAESVDFPVEVEGIDVGHAGDVVEGAHEASVEGGTGLARGQ